MDHTFIMCPICGAKTRVKLRPDTELRNFPLFCPKCKQEHLIHAKDKQVAVVEVLTSGKDKDHFEGM